LSSSVDVYDLGSGACVELFKLNKKLIERDLVITLR